MELTDVFNLLDEATDYHLDGDGDFSDFHVKVNVNGEQGQLRIHTIPKALARYAYSLQDLELYIEFEGIDRWYPVDEITVDSEIIGGYDY